MKSLWMAGLAAVLAAFSPATSAAAGENGVGRVRLINGPLVTALAIPAPLGYGDYRWNDEDVPDGPITIDVFPEHQIITVARARHEIGTAVVLYGARNKPTPKGVFRIKAKWADHRSSTYGTDMPYTLRLTDDGISIHAVDVQRGAATYGCVGVPIEFARRLFELARVGGTVIVH